ncbi:Structural maintenance of chromosomes protein 6B [Camellia lanceoleosa]|uniref:Structural maintenance of chromosomes protein 6B n=1 Tax=Camellia lanceoleosa TaxID=1840588 RepID=A0ACC0GF57_9ERIC|nr:Structural maintenance of chromosomes protein 6B [Camellia lanceoleosa]
MTRSSVRSVHAFVISDYIKPTRSQLLEELRVTNLLQAIERHHHRFKGPPIGLIGAHVSLVRGDTWAVAIESAIGKLLNAFILTDHRDSILLRGCVREAGYN